MNFDELFDRHLLVVVGKGGVGKTTVACALGLQAARRGKRALICEVDGRARTAHLFGVEPAPIGKVVEARPGVFLMAVEGKAALAEYLGLIIPVRRFLQAVFKSRVYQYFVAAAPGLKELMTVGKIWYEAERTDKESSKRCWDIVIMDAPPTGHSLQYLRMPAAAREAFTAGLVHREADRVVGLLTDPTRTAVNLVATAEEMPVNETLSMYRQLREELCMPSGMLFINRVHRSDFFNTDIERLLSRAARTGDRKEKQVLTQVAARAREEAGWTRLNARYRTRLAEGVDMPVIELPYLFTEEFGSAEVHQLAELMAGGESVAGWREGRA